MINKLKDKNGSTFLFTLFLLALVGIITTVLYGYVITQTKLTKKTEGDIKYMYIAQGGIESATGEFISNIVIDPPNYELSKTETPNYIPNDSIAHRIGRYILTLTEEVGIINGNMNHINKRNMNAENNNNQNNWKNKEIGSIINNKNGLKDTLDSLNDLTRKLDEISSIDTVAEVGKAIYYLDRVDLLLKNIESSLSKQSTKSRDSNNLTSSQKEYIQENMIIAKEMSWYLRTIIDKSNKSNVYYNYEYFISPTDSHADNLDTTIEKIIGNKSDHQSDINILEKLIEKSVEYINKMPSQISNLNTDRHIKYEWENLSKMASNLSSSKSSIIDAIKLDLNKAKSCKDKQYKLKYITSASIKLNKIVVMIGEVNADNVLNSIISRYLVSKSDLNNLSSDSESIARITVQNARRTLKASQITCDYIQYKLSKGVLNIYNDSILDSTINNLSDIKIEGYSKEEDQVKSIIKKLNIVNNQLDNLQREKFKDNTYYIRDFDRLVKRIISIPRHRKNELAESIELLQEEHDRISMLNNQHYNSNNYNAEIVLNESINTLKNLEVALNNLVIDNNYTNTSFSSKNNVIVHFSKRLNNTNNNDEKLYVNLEDIKAKIKLKGTTDDNNDYFISDAEIDSGRLSINPNRDLEFNLVLNSTVNKSKKNKIKINCSIYINNINIIIDKNQKPIDVNYDINYKILGMSEER